VLPLVPAYLGYLGGTAVSAGGQERPGLRGMTTFLHALLFVLGFGLVFVALGATATLLGSLLRENVELFRRVGSVLLVILGMRLMGVQRDRRWWVALAVLTGLLTLLLSQNDPLLRLVEGLAMVAVVLAGAGFPMPVQAGLALLAGVLNLISSPDLPVPNAIASALIAVLVFFLAQADIFYTEKRLEMRPGTPGPAGSRGQMGYLRSLLVGVIFAAGWTPCIGPILAGVLMLAGSLNTVGQGVALLAVYSLGLGIPFLIIGLLFDRMTVPLRKASRYLGIVSTVSGALLVAVGVLMFTDTLTRLAGLGSFFNLQL
jgi:cytochrome c-type biogenesis protein